MVIPLPQAFYGRETQEVARDLLGKLVVRRLAGGETLAGIVVETEAYTQDDPASHSFRGRTMRNGAMFGPPGHAYIYFTYGLHTMLNAVTRPEGVGEAVLIRALEPVAGLDIMQKLRGGVPDTRMLTNGPGKLAQALGLSRTEDDGADLTDPRSPILIAEYEYSPFSVTETMRIGITQAKDWPRRYYIDCNRFISRR